MLIVVEYELTLLLFHYLILVFRVFCIKIRNLIMGRYDPRMRSEVGCSAHFLNVEALHFILRKPLLHAPAYESLTILRKSVEDFDKGQRLLVGLVCGAGEILDRVDQAAGGLDVRNLLQVLLIDHLEVARCGQDQQDAQIEQILLL